MQAAKHDSSRPTCPRRRRPPARRRGGTRWTSWSTTRASTSSPPTFDTDDADFDTHFDTNLRAPYILVQKLVPGMVERGHGCVVNISTVAASTPSAGRRHLRRQQGGAGPADQALGRRVRRSRGARQRRRARTDRDAGHSGVSRNSSRGSAAPRRSSGSASPTRSPARSRSSPHPQRATSTAWFCQSMAARWRSGPPPEASRRQHRVQRGVEQPEPVVGRARSAPRSRARGAASARPPGRWPTRCPRCRASSRWGCRGSGTPRALRLRACRAPRRTAT